MLKNAKKIIQHFYFYFNLSFHHPHKDTCQKYDLKIKATSDPNEKSSLLEKHSTFQKSSMARKALKED